MCQLDGSTPPHYAKAFRIKTPILRNEQPAYTEAVYLWRHYLDERILDNGKNVCRKLDAKQKYQCVKGESKGYYPVGPLCGSGCRVRHSHWSSSSSRVFKPLSAGFLSHYR